MEHSKHVDDTTVTVDAEIRVHEGFPLQTSPCLAFMGQLTVDYGSGWRLVVAHTDIALVVRDPDTEPVRLSVESSPFMWPVRFELSREAWESLYRWRCPCCGSAGVEGQSWYKLNDETQTDAQDGAEFWCPDCNVHTKHVCEVRPDGCCVMHGQPFTDCLRESAPVSGDRAAS